MKKLKIPVILLFATMIIACSDDDNNESTSTTGNVNLVFNNLYGNESLTVKDEEYASNGTETVVVDTLKYIISNIRLSTDSGFEYTLEKDNSFFIGNVGNSPGLDVKLESVPVGDYTKITFGIGVDQAKYLQGADGQGDFLMTATDEGMLWTWQAGYKFIRYEGSFKADADSAAEAFSIHMGSHGSALDNYKEVTLDLPSTLRLGGDGNATIGLATDVSMILMGTNKIMLNDKAQIHVDPENSPKIAANVQQMFSVTSVKN